jgi:hypothetical protein
MKKQTVFTLIATIVAYGIGLASLSAVAGPDEAQRQMVLKLHAAKQKLQQAEAAKGAKRQKLLDEHMKMMQETMEKMQTMKPKAGMTMQEHEEWINQHQKLMEDMMGQMMEEHHMMMGMDCMSMGSDDEHTH